MLVRRIVALSVGAENGLIKEYEVGRSVGELEVKDIVFRRDGVVGVNPQRPLYLVKIKNELTKEIIFKGVPEESVKELTFIEIDEKEEDTEVDIKKV